MLPFDMLMEVENVLVASLSGYTHPDLERFWKSCDLPSQIVAPYYTKRQPPNPYFYTFGPSKKTIITGIIDAIDKQGDLGALERILSSAVRTLEPSSDLGRRLEAVQKRIIKREITAPVKPEPAPSKQAAPSVNLTRLKEQFLRLVPEQEGQQQRGYALEVLMNELFDIEGLKPLSPFRLTGEQIDGGFVLGDSNFLCEMRWRAQKASAADLYVLREKVTGKFSGTKGLFISISGFGDDVVEALVKGKEQVLILMDGEDLWFVLDGQLKLTHLLHEKVSEASFRGNPYLKARTLLYGSN